jgi:hypothetical protein
MIIPEYTMCADEAGIARMAVTNTAQCKYRTYHDDDTVIYSVSTDCHRLYTASIEISLPHCPQEYRSGCFTIFERR